MNFSVAFSLLLFPAMIILLELGRRLRKRRATSEGSGAIEGAVFGLFGLLLAFTFSGAGSRYDAHRVLLNEELNDIGTAYLRLDFLPAQSQPEMRQLFRDYVTSRLHLYDRVGLEVSPETIRLQGVIWKRSLQYCYATGANGDAGRLLLPAVNSMIDVTSTRQSAFNMHPAVAVPVLLFLFSCLSAFMAGYSMKFGGGDWVYSIALAAAVTLTVYATLDIEYPRRGLIRLTDSDHGLIALRNSMK